MDRENGAAGGPQFSDAVTAAEARLIQQLRQGDADAGYQFMRDYYPGVYRYLLFLTGRPETAEDLAQETFLQAWRRLDRFEGRAPLRVWLHSVAHREFLQALRSQRPLTSLEEIGEPGMPAAPDWTQATELRHAVQSLPVDEGEVVVLHYLEGYSYAEIARIVSAPITTVKYRLSAARAHLQRVLGEGDLVYLNDPGLVTRRWEWLPLEQMRTLEARCSRLDRSLSTEGERKMSDPIPTGMSRRRLLGAAGTAAAAAAAGLAGTAEAGGLNAAEVVDDRLTRKVTLIAKATALTDLCEQLRGETGIALAAGPSVADEKVTVFCEKLPLRDVMRQLSRPFGYTWLRSGNPGQYRYELVQDLRSQLVEEELRNRDRNMALLVLEREIERYRPYLDLSPDEALERAKSAPPDEKKRLEKLAGAGWGPIQMYFRLSPQDQADLRAGQELNFMAEARPGDRPVPARYAPRPLPADLARGVLQSMRIYRLRRTPNGELLWTTQLEDPTSFPLTAVPDPRAWVKLRLRQSELGQFQLGGDSLFILPLSVMSTGDDALAVGAQAAVLSPENGVVNARWARDPALRPIMRISPGAGSHGSSSRKAAAPPAAAGEAEQASAPGPEAERVTTADVLEALHHAAGLPIVADFYTRLYDPAAVTLHDQPLFQALNHLSDRIRLRWSKDTGSREVDLWLEFRSMSFYDDRLKEVPNRLLSRWSASRREHGALTIDDLCEIAQLLDAQLDGQEMAEGAKRLWGLKEWDLSRSKNLRPHLRFLASLTPDQRRMAMRTEGLAFEQMSLAQQQQYITLGVIDWDEPLQSLEELAGGVLRVEYTQPGWFEWRVPGHAYFQWIVPIGSGAQIRRATRPQIRERTPEAALEAARQLYPHGFEAEVQAVKHLDARFDAAAMVPQMDQIEPSVLDLKIIYIPGASIKREIHWVNPDTDWSYGTYWPGSPAS